MDFLNEFPDDATLPAVLLVLLVIHPGCLVPLGFLVLVIYSYLPTGFLADEGVKKEDWVSRGWNGLFPPVFLQRVALGWNKDCSNPRSVNEMGRGECAGQRFKEN